MISDAPEISYVLAVHNAEGFLADSVRSLIERLAVFPSVEIVLVENGSRDRSLPFARELAERLRTPAIDIRVESVAPGLGNAFRRGLAISRGALVVVVGAELPFGFSDLNRWLVLDDPPALVLGSKSHGESRVSTPVLRRLMSLLFRAARSSILGIRTGDTQGSLLIDGELARRIEPHLACTDYLVTTEICAWAARLGAQSLEVPVTYHDPAPSTVSPVRDGLRMLRGMFALRRRLRADGSALAAERA